MVSVETKPSIITQLSVAGRLMPARKAVIPQKKKENHLRDALMVRMQHALMGCDNTSPDYRYGV